MEPNHPCHHTSVEELEGLYCLKHPPPPQMDATTPREARGMMVVGVCSDQLSAVIYRHHLSSPRCIICSNSWPASRDHPPDIANGVCDVPNVLSEVLSEVCDAVRSGCASALFEEEGEEGRGVLEGQDVA